MLITRAKNISIEAELTRRNHPLKRVGGELVGPCPVCAGRDRFAVNVRRQLWNCRQCAKGGDVIDLVRHIDGVSITEAVATLTGDQARPIRTATTAPAAIDNDDDERKRLEAALRIWRESTDIEGTGGEAYFRRRGITLADVPNYGGLRWHPRCPWENGTAPCVIARFTDAVTGEARGIWRRPVDGGKPKSLGSMGGCVIRLWPDEDVTTGLVIGEGVETTLSVATRFVLRGTLLRPAWAVASAGNLENFPVLPGIEALTILADNDSNGRGQEAAKRCATRWAEAGREVVRFTPHKTNSDFNDMVMRHAKRFH
jgi:phage/plasmid primase-like uncharacterized protein